MFHDENEMVSPIPDFLSSFGFGGGLLGGFKKKKDAYDFIAEFITSLELGTEQYKKILIANSTWIKQSAQ